MRKRSRAEEAGSVEAGTSISKLFFFTNRVVRAVVGALAGVMGGRRPAFICDFNCSYDEDPSAKAIGVGLRLDWVGGDTKDGRPVFFHTRALSLSLVLGLGALVACARGKTSPGTGLWLVACG